jgi:hypothetical protein
MQVLNVKNGRFGFVLALSLGATAGCGASLVAEAELEEQAASALEALGGERPEIDCPGDLEAEVGAKIQCTLTAPDGTTLGATITITSVDGDDVLFEVETNEG